ncbi:MAG: DinB family protein [Acidobacteriota bacterium]
MKTTATPEEKMDAALEVLDQSRDQVVALIEGISQADSERRPGPDEWSVGEIIHHLLLVEQRHSQSMLAQITGDPGESLDLQQVLATRRMPLEDMADVSKSGKGKAPEGTRPTHGLILTELVQELRQFRSQTKSQLLSHRSRDLDDLWWEHPRFGAMTLYERIRLIGYHDLKHLAQLARV